MSHPGDRPSGSRAAPALPADALVAAAAALAAGAVFWAMHTALIDDSYITLVQARTLAEHGQWGLLPGHTSNTATSPLNVVLLAALILVVQDPMWVCGRASARRRIGSDMAGTSPAACATVTSP